MKIKINWRIACLTIAIVYQGYSVFNLVFFISTFASPNFIVLVAMNFLSERASTLGRLMFAVAQVSFFATYLMNASILHLAINWENPRLVWPFFFWSVIHIIWELILICINIVFYQDYFTMLLILWQIFTVIATVVSVIVIWMSYSAPKEATLTEDQQS